MSPDGWPVGLAFPAGRLDVGHHAVATFRLVVGKVELPGRFVCVGRTFIAEADWAGGLA